MFYLYDRAHLLYDVINGAQARILYREARAEAPDNRLIGDLERGFSFWAIVIREGPKKTLLVRCDVFPIPPPGPSHGPDDELFALPALSI